MPKVRGSGRKSAMTRPRPGTSASVPTVKVFLPAPAARPMAPASTQRNAPNATGRQAWRVRSTLWRAAKARFASEAPVKTVGSFWPYATTLFDYTRRAMPYDAPQSPFGRRTLCGHGLCSASERDRRGGCRSGLRQACRRSRCRTRTASSPTGRSRRNSGRQERGGGDRDEAGGQARPASAVSGLVRTLPRTEALPLEWGDLARPAADAGTIRTRCARRRRWRIDDHGARPADHHLRRCDLGGVSAGPDPATGKTRAGAEELVRSHRDRHHAVPAWQLRPSACQHPAADHPARA